MELLTLASMVATDRDDLKVGLPVSVEDAFATERGAREFQGYLRFDRIRNDPDGRTRFPSSPDSSRRISEREVSIEVPYRLGTATETSQGNVRIQRTYNLIRRKRRLQRALGFGFADSSVGFHANMGPQYSLGER